MHRSQRWINLNVINHRCSWDWVLITVTHLVIIVAEISTVGHSLASFSYNPSSTSQKFPTQYGWNGSWLQYGRNFILDPDRLPPKSQPILATSFANWRECQPNTWRKWVESLSAATPLPERMQVLNYNLHSWGVILLISHKAKVDTVNRTVYSGIVYRPVSVMDQTPIAKRMRCNL
jgi:hypothetical protein